MSPAATSKSAARGGRALLLPAAAVIAGAAALMGGVGGASATSLALCTTTTSAPTATPSSAIAGTPITYTATVTVSSGCANGAPTGTVAFYSNYIVNGQPTSFQIGNAVTLQPTATPGQSIATLVDNSLPAGSFQITASYTSNNEALFFDSGPGAGTSVVVQNTLIYNTVMDFTENPTTLTVGQPVTFHVHITSVDASGNPAGPAPTGTVHLSAGPTAAPDAQTHFASVDLDATGSFTYSYGGFVVGDYVVIASYTGNPIDHGISGQLPLKVLPASNPIATTTSIAADPSSISTGDTTVLSAHVVESATQTPPPAGGTVDFFAGPNPTNVQFEGSGILDANGDAQLGVGNFSTGSYVIRAQYLGDTGISGSSGDGSLLVSTAAGSVGTTNPTQLAYTGSVEAVYGAQTTLTGTLEKGNGDALSGEPLTLTMGTQSCTTGLTDGSGAASCQITVAQSSGQYPVTAHFAGDANWAASDAAGTFTVDPAATSLVYTGATTSAYGASATLSATLTNAGGDPIGNETVHLTMGSQSCDAFTGGSGNAGCAITVLQAPSTYPVSVTFGGDTTYSGSSAAATFTFTVTAASTSTAYTGATQGTHGASALLSAHVAGAPDGAPVVFTVGTQTCTGTVSGGDASCSVTLADDPGTGYTVKAAYAGDAAHLGNSDAKPFTIFSPTTTTQAGLVDPVLTGTEATLTATVSPTAATGIVTFSTGGTTLCTGPLSGGAASCTATFSQAGSYTVTARYGGDTILPPSSGATTVLVYALAPGGGAFVVGDKSASGAVTFWGAQAWKENVLSGGAAPSAFKGYALSPAAPRCGVAWSTGPGNSSPPPAGPLPAYMAVIVSSKITKSGSQISGNTVAVVIVKTNAGYDANPGHAGTGTVVTTLCGG